MKNGRLNFKSRVKHPYSNLINSIIISCILVLGSVFGIFASFVGVGYERVFAKGIGTKEDPYVISDADDFFTLQQIQNGEFSTRNGKKVNAYSDTEFSYYSLESDIDMQEVYKKQKTLYASNDSSIYMQEEPTNFVGYLEGNGHKILNQTTSLFNKIEEGSTVSNLIMGEITDTYINKELEQTVLMLAGSLYSSLDLLRETVSDYGVTDTSNGKVLFANASNFSVYKACFDSFDTLEYQYKTLTTNVKNENINSINQVFNFAKSVVNIYAGLQSIDFNTLFDSVSADIVDGHEIEKKLLNYYNNNSVYLEKATYSQLYDMLVDVTLPNNADAVYLGSVTNSDTQFAFMSNASVAIESAGTIELIANHGNVYTNSGLVDETTQEIIENEENLNDKQLFSNLSVNQYNKELEAENLELLGTHNTSNKTTAGIVGSMSYGSVTSNSYNTGSITAASTTSYGRHAAGIAGTVLAGAEVNYCHNDGTVTAGAGKGGSNGSGATGGSGGSGGTSSSKNGKTGSAGGSGTGGSGGYGGGYAGGIMGYATKVNYATGCVNTGKVTSGAGGSGGYGGGGAGGGGGGGAYCWFAFTNYNGKSGSKGTNSSSRSGAAGGSGGAPGRTNSILNDGGSGGKGGNGGGGGAGGGSGSVGNIVGSITGDLGSSAASGKSGSGTTGGAVGSTHTNNYGKSGLAGTKGRNGSTGYAGSSQSDGTGGKGGLGGGGGLGGAGGAAVNIDSRTATKSEYNAFSRDYWVYDSSKGYPIFYSEIGTSKKYVEFSGVSGTSFFDGKQTQTCTVYWNGSSISLPSNNTLGASGTYGLYSTSSLSLTLSNTNFRITLKVNGVQKTSGVSSIDSSTMNGYLTANARNKVEVSLTYAGTQYRKLTIINNNQVVNDSGLISPTVKIGSTTLATGTTAQTYYTYSTSTMTISAPAYSGVTYKIYVNDVLKHTSTKSAALSFSVYSYVSDANTAYTIKIEVSSDKALTGNGTKTNPYQINNNVDWTLFTFSDLYKNTSSYYVLNANITATRSYTTTFSGAFNGNNFTITNNAGSALFTTISSGIVHSLYVSTGSTSYSNGSVFCRTLTNSSLINIRLVLSKAITLTSYNGSGGGIASEATGSKIFGCSVNTNTSAGTITISNNTKAGGIVGFAYGSMQIAGCQNYAKISATTYIVGGIVGFANGSGTFNINNCFNNGEVIGVCSGGIVGYSAGSGMNYSNNISLNMAYASTLSDRTYGNLNWNTYSNTDLSSKYTTYSKVSINSSFGYIINIVTSFSLSGKKATEDIANTEFINYVTFSLGYAYSRDISSYSEMQTYAKAINYTHEDKLAEMGYVFIKDNPNYKTFNSGVEITANGTFAWPYSYIDNDPTQVIATVNKVDQAVNENISYETPVNSYGDFVKGFRISSVNDAYLYIELKQNDKVVETYGSKEISVGLTKLGQSYTIDFSGFSSSVDLGNINVNENPFSNAADFVTKSQSAQFLNKYTIDVYAYHALTGSGTQSNPYIVDEPEDLNVIHRFATNTNVWFKQTSNITMSSTLGGAEKVTQDNVTVFYGQYDGQNYTISNVYRPIFCVVETGSVVKNLYISPTTSSTQILYASTPNEETNKTVDAFGLLAGTIEKGGVVRNITVNNVNKNAVDIHLENLNKSLNYVGSIIGVNKGIVDNCVNYSDIYYNSNDSYSKSISYLGGIVGYNHPEQTSVIENCMNFSNVGGYVNGYVGGISGVSYGVIRNCIVKNSSDFNKNCSVISSSGNNGGLVGYTNFGAIIENSINASNIGTMNSSRYGLVGYVAGTTYIQNSYYLSTGATAANGGNISLINENKNGASFAQSADTLKNLTSLRELGVDTGMFVTNTTNFVAYGTNNPTTNSDSLPYLASANSKAITGSAPTYDSSTKEVLINNINELYYVLQNFMNYKGSTIKLVNDLDATGYLWLPGVLYENTTLDGDGHTIYGINASTKDRNSLNGFLQAVAKNAVIKDINFDNFYSYSYIDSYSNPEFNQGLIENVIGANVLIENVDIYGYVRQVKDWTNSNNVRTGASLLVGNVTSDGSLTIKDCEIAGSVTISSTAKYRTYLASAMAIANTNNVINISGVSSSAKLYFDNYNASNNVLIGGIAGAQLSEFSNSNVSNNLFTGEISALNSAMYNNYIVAYAIGNGIKNNISYGTYKNTKPSGITSGSITTSDTNLIIPNISDGLNGRVVAEDKLADLKNTEPSFDTELYWYANENNLPTLWHTDDNARVVSLATQNKIVLKELPNQQVDVINYYVDFLVSDLTYENNKTYNISFDYYIISKGADVSLGIGYGKNGSSSYTDDIAHSVSYNQTVGTWQHFSYNYTVTNIAEGDTANAAFRFNRMAVANTPSSVAYRNIEVSEVVGGESQEAGTLQIEDFYSTTTSYDSNLKESGTFENPKKFYVKDKSNLWAIARAGSENNSAEYFINLYVNNASNLATKNTTTIINIGKGYTINKLPSEIVGKNEEIRIALNKETKQYYIKVKNPQTVANSLGSIVGYDDVLTINSEVINSYPTDNFVVIAFKYGETVTINLTTNKDYVSTTKNYRFANWKQNDSIMTTDSQISFVINEETASLYESNATTYEPTYEYMPNKVNITSTQVYNTYNGALQNFTPSATFSVDGSSENYTSAYVMQNKQVTLNLPNNETIMLDRWVLNNANYVGSNPFTMADQTYDFQCILRYKNITLSIGMYEEGVVGRSNLNTWLDQQIWYGNIDVEKATYKSEKHTYEEIDNEENQLFYDSNVGNWSIPTLSKPRIYFNSGENSVIQVLGDLDGESIYLDKGIPSGWTYGVENGVEYIEPLTELSTNKSINIIFYPNFKFNFNMELAGSGTEEDPYLINSIEDWNLYQNLADIYFASGVYTKLTTDLDFEGLAIFVNEQASLKGTFDGDGHKIRNFTIGKKYFNKNLFYNVESTGVIKNLVLEDFYMEGFGDMTAPLVGTLNGGTIYNVGVISTDPSKYFIKTNGYHNITATLVSYTKGNSIIDTCYSNYNIKVVSYNPNNQFASVITGLTLGFESGFTIKNSYYVGTLNGGDTQVGIATVAYVESGTPKIENCYFFCTLVDGELGTNNKYGIAFNIVGSANGAIIENCYSKDVPVANTTTGLVINNSKQVTDTELKSIETFKLDGKLTWDFNSTWRFVPITTDTYTSYKQYNLGYPLLIANFATALKIDAKLASNATDEGTLVPSVEGWKVSYAVGENPDDAQYEEVKFGETIRIAQGSSINIKLTSDNANDYYVKNLTATGANITTNIINSSTTDVAVLESTLASGVNAIVNFVGLVAKATYDDESLYIAPDGEDSVFKSTTMQYGKTFDIKYKYAKDNLTLGELLVNDEVIYTNTSAYGDDVAKTVEVENVGTFTINPETKTITVSNVQNSFSIHFRTYVQVKLKVSGMSGNNNIVITRNGEEQTLTTSDFVNDEVNYNFFIDDNFSIVVNRTATGNYIKQIAKIENGITRTLVNGGIDVGLTTLKYPQTETKTAIDAVRDTAYSSEFLVEFVAFYQEVTVNVDMQNTSTKPNVTITVAGSKENSLSTSISKSLIFTNILNNSIISIVASATDNYRFYYTLQGINTIGSTYTSKTEITGGLTVNLTVVELFNVNETKVNASGDFAATTAPNNPIIANITSNLPGSAAVIAGNKESANFVDYGSSITFAMDEFNSERFTFVDWDGNSAETNFASYLIENVSDNVNVTANYSVKTIEIYITLNTVPLIEQKVDDITYLVRMYSYIYGYEYEGAYVTPADMPAIGEVVPAGDTIEVKKCVDCGNYVNIDDDSCVRCGSNNFELGYAYRNNQNIFVNHMSPVDNSKYIAKSEGIVMLDSNNNVVTSGGTYHVKYTVTAGETLMVSRGDNPHITQTKCTGFSARPFVEGVKDSSQPSDSSNFNEFWYIKPNTELTQNSLDGLMFAVSGDTTKDYKIYATFYPKIAVNVSANKENTSLIASGTQDERFSADRVIVTGIEPNGEATEASMTDGGFLVGSTITVRYNVGLVNGYDLSAYEFTGWSINGELILNDDGTPVIEGTKNSTPGVNGAGSVTYTFSKNGDEYVLSYVIPDPGKTNQTYAGTQTIQLGFKEKTYTINQNVNVSEGGTITVAEQDSNGIYSKERDITSLTVGVLGKFRFTLTPNASYVAGGFKTDSIETLIKGKELLVPSEQVQLYDGLTVTGVFFREVPLTVNIKTINITNGKDLTGGQVVVSNNDGVVDGIYNESETLTITPNLLDETR